MFHVKFFVIRNADGLERDVRVLEDHSQEVVDLKELLTAATNEASPFRKRRSAEHREDEDMDADVSIRSFESPWQLQPAAASTPAKADGRSPSPKKRSRLGHADFDVQVMLPTTAADPRFDPSQPPSQPEQEPASSNIQPSFHAILRVIILTYMCDQRIFQRCFPS